MANRNPYNAYQNASATMDKGQQLIMLYAGAINFLKKSKEAIDAKNYNECFELISRACAIINGLNSSIDFTINKEIAKALDEYYHSIDNRMIIFQHNYDLDLCDQIIDDLQSMHDNWKKVVAKQKS